MLKRKREKRFGIGAGQWEKESKIETENDTTIQKASKMPIAIDLTGIVSGHMEGKMTIWLTI